MRSNYFKTDFRNAINAVKYVNENVFVTGDDIGIVKAVKIHSITNYRLGIRVR